MIYNQAYKQIMLEYDKDRQNSKILRDTLTQEIYKNIPQIVEIDKKLLEISVEISKSILNRNIDRETLLKDLENKSLELQTEKELLLVYHNYPKDYLSSVYKCKLCQDTGYIDNKKCNCLKQRLINKYYNLSNLKDTLQNENFDNFDIRFYSDKVDPTSGISPKEKIKAIHQTCLKFVTNFGAEFKNLFFYGNAGLGKTFLCNCIAKSLLDKGIPVLYVTSAQLFKTIEQERFNRDEMDNPYEQINMFHTIDLLIIDDLGTEFSTIVTQSELFNIINSRLLNKKPTIISTNLSPKDFENQYSDRMISRFVGNYELIRFIGEDIRSKKKYTPKK